MDIRGLVQSARDTIPTLLERGRYSDVVRTFLDVTFTALLQHEERLDRHHKVIRHLWNKLEAHEDNVNEAIQEMLDRVEPAVSQKFEEVQLLFEQAA
eukprot:778566-Karenia_brevis.AAC.1